MNKTVLLVFLLIGLIALGFFGYSYLNDDFYSKHQVTFGELKEKQYNGSTFMAVFYDPSCEVCLKAEQVFEEFADKHKVEAVTVDVTTIDKNLNDSLIQNGMGVPTFYFFIDGQLAISVKGYHPLHVYEEGLEIVKNMLNEREENSTEVREE